MKNQQPNTNELELSLFGPGIGECAVIHLGNGEWMVVDSCLNLKRDRPVAIEYLSHLGVDIESSVKLIVATHWHDDHIQGMSQTLRAASGAKFACSAALLTEEFLALVSSPNHLNFVANTSGCSEFADVLDVLRQRSPLGERQGPDYWAHEGTTLFSGKTSNVFALSPSAQSVTDSKRHFASLLPNPETPICAFPRLSPNRLSVALLIGSPEISFLLGGDLESGTDQASGWHGVISSSVRPVYRSCAYKVAHHGSSNAEHVPIWTDLLVPKPIAAIAPYARGRLPLPAKTDIKRILKRTDLAYCTKWPITVKPPRRPSVDGVMSRITRNRKAVSRVPGHIRIRSSFSGDGIPSVELFDGATKLGSPS